MMAVRRVGSIDDLPMCVRLLLAVRRKRGWTQTELGQALQTHRRTIQRWEGGDTEPPLFVMAALRELMSD